MRLNDMPMSANCCCEAQPEISRGIIEHVQLMKMCRCDMLLSITLHNLRSTTGLHFSLLQRAPPVRSALLKCGCAAPCHDQVAVLMALQCPLRACTTAQLLFQVPHAHHQLETALQIARDSPSSMPTRDSTVAA